MILTIKGGTAFQRKLTEAAVNFAKQEMLPRLRTLDITVRLRKFSKDEGNVVGWCIYEDASHKHREFTIEVSTEQALECFVKTIMHEMVHVKQYALAQMREACNDRGGHAIYWKGTNHTKTAYTKSPWEKEAYRLQDKLYDKFMKNMMSDMV